MTNSRPEETPPGTRPWQLASQPPLIISRPYKNRGQSSADQAGPLLIRDLKKLGTSSRHFQSWVTRRTHSPSVPSPPKRVCRNQPLDDRCDLLCLDGAQVVEGRRTRRAISCRQRSLTTHQVASRAGARGCWSCFGGRIHCSRGARGDGSAAYKYGLATIHHRDTHCRLSLPCVILARVHSLDGPT